MSQAQFLKDFVRGEILEDDSSRQKYSVDASIFEVIPDSVVCPADLADLTAIVQKVSSLRQEGIPISITARAAGTCMSGGSLTQSIVLDMTRHFGGISFVDEKLKRITVGSGTYHRDVEAALTPKKLLFPPYTSSKDICAIGGMIGNNASGEKSMRYGATTNWVRTLYVVLSDGNQCEFGPISLDQLEAKKQLQTLEGALYREVCNIYSQYEQVINMSVPNVRKNAAGYAIWRVWNKEKTVFNMAKLFVGAQGTLGIVTGAILDVTELPKHKVMVAIAIDSLPHLAEAIKLILAERPEGLEVYDKHTYELAKVYYPEDAGRTTMSEGNEMVLFAQFSEHTPEHTYRVAEICMDILKDHKFNVKLVDDPAEADSYWKIRRASYGMLKDHAHGTKRAVPFIEDTIINTAHYGEFVASLEAILQDYDMTYTYAGHIGDGSIRLIPLVDMEAEGAAIKIFDLARRVYDLTFAFGGSMSVDHNDGLIRTPFLESMYGKDMVSVFEQIKDLFDPFCIFNPGKKVRGDLSYSIAHVSKTNNQAKT